MGGLKCLILRPWGRGARLHLQQEGEGRAVGIQGFMIQDHLERGGDLWSGEKSGGAIKRPEPKEGKQRKG